jgi:hypothetical protein
MNASICVSVMRSGSNAIIDNGISPSGMPASKGILSDEETWQLVLFIRHLPRAGSLNEPRACTGDRKTASRGPGIVR